MNELINVINDEVVTTSLRVAEVFGKRHTHVLEKIGQLLNEPKNGLVNMFKKSSYIDAKGEHRPMYYITRDGFSLLVMGFTGRKALDWKLKYIEAFNQMEKYINFRKADKQIQKNAMEFLFNNLEMPTGRDCIKANTIANKAVSNMYGFPKMIKKDEMTEEMLEQRQPILAETVELMAVNDKYNLDISVSENIYKRHTMIEGGLHGTI
jgi:Rha family phage regulatory protein